MMEEVLHAAVHSCSVFSQSDVRMTLDGLRSGSLDTAIDLGLPAVSSMYYCPE